MGEHAIPKDPHANRVLGDAVDQWGMYQHVWTYPDLAGRWVIMLSHLYYDRAVSIIPDFEFDRLCRYVSDHFDEISPVVQWQLGSAEAIKSSGFHVKITCMGASSANGIAARSDQYVAPYVFPFLTADIHPKWGFRYVGMSG